MMYRELLVLHGGCHSVPVCRTGDQIPDLIISLGVSRMGVDGLWCSHEYVRTLQLGVSDEAQVRICRVDTPHKLAASEGGR